MHRFRIDGAVAEVNVANPGGPGYIYLMPVQRTRLEPAELPPTLTYAAARAQMSDHELRRLVEQGILIRLGRGVYRRAEAPSVDEDLLEIAVRAPEATLCLVTALARHELTDTIPARLDLALPRTRRAPKVTAPVAWHRFDEDTFDIGRGSVDLGDGIAIGLYRPERCIIDVFRLRHREGEEVAVEALRRWLRRPGSNPSAVLTLARAFPAVEPSLINTLRILLP